MSNEKSVKIYIVFHVYTGEQNEVNFDIVKIFFDRWKARTLCNELQKNVSKELQYQYFVEEQDVFD